MWIGLQNPIMCCTRIIPGRKRWYTNTLLSIIYDYDHGNYKEELRGMGCFKKLFVDRESREMN